MIEIDIELLKNEINKLNTNISELEEIELNLFNQLKEACINWQDFNSKKFDNRIYLDKNESNNIINFLIQKKQIYEAIVEKYNQIGKKIKCNVNNSQTLFNVIEEYIIQLSDITKEFNKIDMSFYYEEQQQILEAKNKITETQNILNEYKNNLSSLFKTIYQIEEDIKNKIKLIEELKINELEPEI